MGSVEVEGGGHLEKGLDLLRHLVRGEVFGERLDETDEQEGALEALVQHQPVVLEEGPGQVSANFRRRHRRNDEHRVLKPHVTRHGEVQDLFRNPRFNSAPSTPEFQANTYLKKEKKINCP